MFTRESVMVLSKLKCIQKMSFYAAAKDKSKEKLNSIQLVRQGVSCFVLIRIQRCGFTIFTSRLFVIDSVLEGLCTQDIDGICDPLGFDHRCQ